MDDPATSYEEPKQTLEAPNVMPEAGIFGAAQPLQPLILTPTRRPGHKLTYLAAGLLLLNIFLGIGTVYVHNKHNATTAQLVTRADTSYPSSKTKLASADVTTLHYVSKPLNLEFDYPVDWRLSSSAANTTIKISSSPFKLTDSTGMTHAATINLSINSSNENSFSYDISPSQPISVDSETLKYSNPTASQRPTTNVSFVGSNENAANEINAIFVSGNNVYHKGETVDSHNYAAITPQISMNVDLCAGGLCKQALNTATFKLSNWHDGAEFIKARSLIESLRLN